MNLKLEALRRKMASLDLEGMIVSNPINIKYLINVDAEGVLIINTKENIYITDGRYIEHVHSTLTLFDEVIVYDSKDVSEDDYENFFMFCENVGFEENYITYSDYKECIRKYKINNFVETEYMIEKMRMIKDEEELKNIKKACSVTDECFDFIKKYIKPGMTEKQIAKKVENFYNENSDGLAFDTVVASGENSSKPHAMPTDRKIEQNDIITIDMGCKINGYCSDMTRTIFVGQPTEEMKKIYDLVLNNQKFVLNQYKEGGNTKQITKMVESDFKLYKYYLIHALGHGVGLEIHERPFISSRSENLLQENMVVTDEPGIYIPGKFGIRIEDTVQITKFGCISLTNSEKNYTII